MLGWLLLPPHSQSPSATDAPFSSSPPPTMCLTWSSYRRRGQACGIVVPGTRGGHVSSLGSSLFTWLPRRLREGPPRGGENLVFKGAPPGSGLGLGGGGLRRVSRHSGPSLHPCSSPDPFLDLSQPHPGTQRPLPTPPVPMTLLSLCLGHSSVRGPRPTSAHRAGEAGAR